MIFRPTMIEGVVLVELEVQSDQRGSFARTYCSREFAAHGLDLTIVQTNVSFNPVTGTLRGLHFQAAPEPEPKLVRCTRGRIYDVAVDLRPSSATYCKWASADLDSRVGNALFIPSGCAHGFLTITASAEVSYSMGARYMPALARGVRWNDPLFGIEWPFPPAVISDRDATFDDFEP